MWQIKQVDRERKCGTTKMENCGSGEIKERNVTEEVLVRVMTKLFATGCIEKKFHLM